MGVFAKALKCAALAMTLAATAWVSSARAEEDPAYLTIGAGTWETLRGNLTQPELDMSFQSDYKLWIFKPQVGVMAAKDGDFYAFTGFVVDVYWGPHIVTTGSTAIGYYGGGGYDLGSHFEFRNGLIVSWKFEDKSRLGVGFFHISNAGITDRNGGSESALLTYSYPLGHLFSDDVSYNDASPSTQFSRGNNNRY